MKNKEGFSSVSEFSTHLLRSILSESKKEELTKQEIEKVKKKLKSLGYLG